MTGDYEARVATLIKGDLGHVWTVTVQPVSGPSFTLECEDIEVTMAEDWAPHVQAKLVGSIPESLTQLDALDGRRNCRIIIQAGYVYKDGTVDIHQLADLGLRNRRTSRPSNQMGLAASSDEAKAMDRRRAEFYGSLEFDGLNDLVKFFADYAVYPEVATLDTNFPDNGGYASIAGMEVNIGTPMWDAIEDAAARCGKWVYCTPGRFWRLTDAPSLGGTVRHVLAVGKDSTIFAADSEVDRTGFANQSIVEYAWQDAEGVSHTVYGRAAVTSGPFSVNSIGYVSDHKRYDRPATQAQANAAAASRVKGLVTRGRGLSLEAHAAYWLRPGHTINVQLPTGPAEDHLIKSITFYRQGGRMLIHTRQPMDVTITTGE